MTDNRYGRRGSNNGAYGDSNRRSSSSYTSNSSRRSSSSSYGRHDITPSDDSSRYSRQRAYNRYDDTKRRRKRRKVITIALIVVGALLVCGVAGALIYVHNIDKNIHQNVDEGLADVLEPASTTTASTSAAGDPFYMLLLGVDNDADRAANGDNSRSDSIILARIDPQQKQVTLISIHRDTIVNIPGYGDDKINAAYAYGGQALIVQTVSQFAGVPITHYAEVDMDGFIAIVDVLGGVTVDVPETFYDDVLGGGLEAGTQTLNSDQAIIFCRARHAFDDLGDGDVFRANHQRLFLAAIAKKILSSDAATMASTISTLSQYITTDMSLSDIVSLATQMRGMDTDKSIYSAMNPTTSEYVDDTWYENSDTAEWQAMMARVDQGLTPTADESSSTDADKAVTSCDVVIRNGSGIDGAGETAASRLSAAGITVSDVGTADADDYATTMVLYDKQTCAAAAEKMASILGCGQALQDSDSQYNITGDILIVIGQDWK